MEPTPTNLPGAPKKQNPFLKFLKKHWLDAVVICAISGLVVWFCLHVAESFDFPVRWDKFYNYFVTYKGYNDLLTGLKNTGLIAVFGLLIGIVIGIFIAVIKLIPSKKKPAQYAKTFCTIYVAFFRGTPIVVQLLLGWFILRPILGLTIEKEFACTLIFGLNSGAYISEIMRGGINSVDPGQLEAARAVGLSYTVSMVKIVIPQAIKNILPTLGNEFIALIKETAIVGYVGATDITFYFQTQAATTYEAMIPYLVMALIYIVLVAIIAGLVKLLERSLSKNERRKA